MIDFILHAVAFVAWLIYTFPPSAAAKSERVQLLRAIIAAVLAFCIGAGLGHALVEVFLK